MTEDAADVLIVGAGPVGLTLANELARRGVRPLIVDRAGAIREVSKALILHVRTQEALLRVGIADAVRAEARPLTRVMVNAYGSFVGSWNLDGVEGPFAHPLILGQNRTQHLLLDALAARGVAVRWRTELVGLHPDADGAEAELLGEEGRRERIRARFVVGCEGSNSLVRKTAGFSFAGERYAGEQFIQADCRIRWPLPEGRSYLFLTADGYLMVIEMPGGGVRIFISLPDATASEGAGSGELGAAEAVAEQPTLEEIARHLTRLTGYGCELSDALWLARYRTSHRYADRFRSGPLLVAGDAGHVHVPIGGQGMNTGIQDAFNLGWKLAGVLCGDLAPAVLDSYEQERHPVAEGLIRGTDLAYRGILHPSEARQRAVRMMGPFLLRSARVQGFMRETLEELSIRYPNSSLNLDLGGATGAEPGTRMPDAAVVRASDLVTSTLYRETPTDAWALLVFAGDGGGEDGRDPAAEAAARFGERLRTLAVARRPAGPGAAGLLDAAGEAHARFGVGRPAAVLVRPDAVVAARAPLGRWPKVAEHLAGLMPPRPQRS